MNAIPLVSRISATSPTGRLSPSTPQWQELPSANKSAVRQQRESQRKKPLLSLDFSALELRVLAHSAR